MTEAMRMGVPGRAHDLLLVALIALRPLVWSGDAGAWDNLAWLLLALGALVWLVADAWRGRVPAWRFGIGGLIAAALLLILLPAALRSPSPSTGMGLWGMAVIHLGFAGYLMQVVPGRERLAFGAFVGALAVECLVALGQWAWVLPGMAAALAGGDPAVAALENTHGDLANRVAYGGLFGTFTLANTLAAFLLLAAVPLLGVLVAARGTMRAGVALLLALAAVVAIGTASKGAAVALVLAGLVVWTTQVGGRARWLGPAALVIGSAIIMATPTLRGIGAASAEVRLEYWQGATALIAEAPASGHGLNGFAAHGGRTMPLAAEPTRHVHNDVLEATVDGGLLAGLVLLALLAWIARPRPTTTPVTGPTSEGLRLWRAAWPLTLFFPLFNALGMLASNLEWWPLGAGELTWWCWPLGLSAVAIGVAWFSTRLPSPPAWAWQLALIAFALHCLVDFNLQSPGIWGTLIISAVLAGGRIHGVGVCAISRSAVGILVLLCLAGSWFGVRRAIQLNLDANHLAAFSRHDTTGESPDAERVMGYLVLASAMRWPSDATLALAALRTIPAGAERIRVSSLMAEQQPWNAQVHECLAQDHVALSAWLDGVEAMRRAVEQDPAYLPRRQRLVELLERAAVALPASAAELRQVAQSQRQRIADLGPLVHLRNRLTTPTASALPVQPTP